MEYDDIIKKLEERIQNLEDKLNRITFNEAKEVSVKDAIWDSGNVVPAGMGNGNVEEILRNLKADGYQGYLSLEPHLGDFTGFSELEQAAEKKKKLSGEEAFTLAYHSLASILGKL